MCKFVVCARDRATGVYKPYPSRTMAEFGERAKAEQAAQSAMMTLGYGQVVIETVFEEGSSS